MSAQAFAALSAVGAALAVVANAWASRLAPRPWRRIYAVTAVFALFYVFAWGWLALHPNTDRARWSELVTPVSLATFFVVWSAPAVASITKHRRRRE